MPYFDILVRFIHPDDRNVGVNPDTMYDFVELKQIPWEPPNPDGFQSWYADKYGNSANATWEQMERAYREYMSYTCEGGEFETQIQAHKSSDSLEYKMKKTRGEWTDDSPSVENEQKKISIDFFDTNFHVFSNENVVSVACAEWEGDVFTPSGQLLLPKPDIHVSKVNPEDDNDVRIRLVTAVKCRGTARVVYNIEYDLWKLLIDPRELTEGAGGSSTAGAISTSNPSTTPPDLSTSTGALVPATTGDDGAFACSTYYDANSPQGAFAASVRAIWDGGWTKVDVVVPEDLGTGCPEWGDAVHFPGDDEVPDYNCYDLYVTKDKCTDEILEEELVQVQCTEENS